MTIQRYVSLLILGLTLQAGLLAASAQVLLHRSAVGGGGGLSEGATVQLLSTAGQAAIGAVEGGTVQLGSGFWAQSGTSAGESPEVDPTGDPSVIAVNIDNTHRPLDPILVQVQVGDLAGGQPVNELYGVGFKIGYEAGKISANEGSLTAGGFLGGGDTPLLFEQIDAVNGLVSLGVTRTNATGVSGEGVAATFTFSIPDGAPPGDLAFTLHEILAIDREGNEIPLTPIHGSTYISGIWPGDTDNSCLVEAADLLPIGVGFGQTGAARDGGFDISWGAKPAKFGNWAHVAHAYADATGDGLVNQNDLLPIGLNYQQSRETPDCGGPGKTASVAAVTLEPQPVGTVLPLYLNATEPVADLLGVAFQLQVPSDLLTVQSVRAGQFLDDGDLLTFDQYNAQTGLLDAALTRKGTNAPAYGQGTLVEVVLEVVGATTEPITLDLLALRLSGVDGTTTTNPAAVVLSGEAATATAHEAPLETPATFRLHGAYPNPFNPTTTISYDLPEAGDVTLLVYDMLGRTVRRQEIGRQPAGTGHRVVFDAQGLASGTYLYRVAVRLAGRQEAKTSRFVLLK